MLNQEIFHDERFTYRLCIPTAGVTHPILGAFANKGCIPKPAAKTGLITTDNLDASGGKVVRGVGTIFTSETDFQAGRFLADPNGVVRRIAAVNSDTLLTLEDPFPASLSSAAPQLVTEKPNLILIKSTGAAAAILQEAAFKISDLYYGGGTPVSYDVSLATAEISVEISY